MTRNNTIERDKVVAHDAWIIASAINHVHTAYIAFTTDLNRKSIRQSIKQLNKFKRGKIK